MEEERMDESMVGSKAWKDLELPSSFLACLWVVPNMGKEERWNEGGQKSHTDSTQSITEAHIQTNQLYAPRLYHVARIYLPSNVVHLYAVHGRGGIGGSEGGRARRRSVDYTRPNIPRSGQSAHTWLSGCLSRFSSLFLLSACTGVVPGGGGRRDAIGVEGGGGGGPCVTVEEEEKEKQCETDHRESRSGAAAPRAEATAACPTY